jgi:hypothetical protein
MVTNKALAELASWAHAASLGNGEEAKQRLVQFRHVGAGFVTAPEFERRCQSLYGCTFDLADLERTCRLLDAIANVEVCQVEEYGPAHQTA